MKKLLTLFTLLLCVCSGAWATDLEIPLTNLKNFPLDYGLVTITNTNNVSISSNQLQVSKATGTFRVSTKIDGVYLKSISFTDANSSKNGGFTCTDNASYMTGPTENVYTYTAPNTTTTEANFQLIGSGGTAKMGTIIITVSTSDQVERLSSFGSISKNKIPFTSSAATTNVELSVPASNGVATGSSRINIGSGGKHLIVSAINDKLIKYIAIPKYQQSANEIACTSTPAGTYSNNIWTPEGSSVESVDLTLTVTSTTYTQEIFVIYEDAGVTKPSFDVAAGSSIVKNTASAVTLTSAGNIIYYKWNTTADAYATGAALEDAADGNGTSPVAVTAPSTTGTTYLYAVAKDGEGVYSDVVSRSYTITNQTYIVTLNTNGGTINAGNVTEYEEGTGATLPTNVTKDCYTFAGWYDNSGLTGEAVTTISTDATGSKEYWAKWTPKYATSLNFQAVVEAGTQESNPIATFLSNANMEHSTFSSSVWETGDTPSSEYVGFKLKDDGAYVKFLAKAGSEVTITLGNIAATLELYKDGVKTDISASTGADVETVVPTFTPAEDMLVELRTTSTGTVTLKKIMIETAGDYTITNGSPANGTITVQSSANAGDIVSISAAPNTGYEFIGWNISKTEDSGTTITPESNTANTTFTMPSYNVTVDAVFTAIEYTITHTAAENGTYTIKVADEEPVNTNTVAYIDQTITLAATPADGYALKAWNVTETVSGDEVTMATENTFVMPDATVTIAPEFDVVYTVTFNLQGHGSDIEAQEVLNGGKVTEPTAPTADGWVFGGWYKEAGCTNAWDFDTDVVSANTEIFAKWTEYVAPTAGIIYSADATATWSVSASTDETPYYEIPSTKAAISGGKMYVHNGQSGAKDLIASNYNTSFCFTNNNTNFKIVLNDPLAEGDVITCKSAATNNGCGVAVTATETLNGGTSEIHLAADNGSLNTDTYVVDAEDELCGKSTIYLYRYGGKTTYIGEFTITRNNSIALNNVDGAANGFSTFCSPNNFTVSGATAYKASLADNKLTLTGVTGVIPANEGVILAGTTGATATIAYTNNTATADMEGNDLQGTTARVLTATLKGEYAHFLAFQKTTNTFKEYNGTNFPANKAYVVTNDTEGREFEMIFGEQENDEQGTETDGIAGVEAEKNANVAYNLAGQKVGKDYKGIVIVNGKKVIRK